MKGLLFDCDGLLFETEIISNLMWKEAAHHFQKELPEDFFEHITGSGGENTVEYIRSIGFEDIFDYTKKKRFDLSFWSSIQRDCINRLGLIPLFQWLDTQSYLRAVCSSSQVEYVKTLLNTVSYPLHFSAIVGGDLVKRAKPDPDIFLLGAKALGLNPEDCWVLEDSKAGLMAAKRAGMTTIFIEDTISKDSEMDAYIDFQCHNLEEVISLIKENSNE